MTAIDVVVGRQTIFDRNGSVYGYELLFRQTDPQATALLDGDVMTRSVLFGTIGIGLDRLIGDRFAFVNADRGLLIGEVPVSLPPDQTVIEILETVAPDQAVLTGCRRLKAQGFRLALDDFTWFDGAEALLELADIVKVDLRLTPVDQLPALLSRLARYRVELLAEKVETEAELASCRDLGFDYFQGYALARPRTIPGRIFAPSELSRLRIASTLLSRDLDLDQLEEILSLEPGMTYQLLQMASAGGLAGTRRRIRNVREAFVIAGSRRVQTWMALLALVEGGGSPGSEVMTALIRARMTQLLAGQTRLGRPDLAFTAGMLSALDLLLGIPVAEVLTTLSLSDELCDAAFGDRTPLGRLVRDVVDHVDDRPEPQYRSGLTRDELDLAAMQALSWAFEALEDLTKGQPGRSGPDRTTRAG